MLPSEPTRLGLATGLVGMTLVLMFLSNTFAIYFLSLRTLCVLLGLVCVLDYLY